MTSTLAELAALPPGERGRKAIETVKSLGGSILSGGQQVELQDVVFPKLLEQGEAKDVESIIVDIRAACSIAAFLLENYVKSTGAPGVSNDRLMYFTGSAYEKVVGMLSGVYAYFLGEVASEVTNEGKAHATKVLKEIFRLHDEVISLSNTASDFIAPSALQTASIKTVVNTFYDLGEITVSKTKVCLS